VQNAQTAYNGIGSTLQQLSKPPSHEELMRRMSTPSPNVPDIFYSIQMFLSSCANISKLLWPKPKGRNEAKDQADKRRLRGERLWNAIGATNEPTLQELNSKSLRNYFEHFDERLDYWVANSTHHNLITRSSGPAGSFLTSNNNTVGPADYMGFLDTSTGVVTFQELTVSLPNMYAAVQCLHERTTIASRPSWLRQEESPDQEP